MKFLPRSGKNSKAERKREREGGGKKGGREEREGGREEGGREEGERGREKEGRRGEGGEGAFSALPVTCRRIHME